MGPSPSRTCAIARIVSTYATQPNSRSVHDQPLRHRLERAGRIGRPTNQRPRDMTRSPIERVPSCAARALSIARSKMSRSASPIRAAPSPRYRHAAAQRGRRPTARWRTQCQGPPPSSGSVRSISEDAAGAPPRRPPGLPFRASIASFAGTHAFTMASDQLIAPRSGPAASDDVAGVPLVCRGPGMARQPSRQPALLPRPAQTARWAA